MLTAVDSSVLLDIIMDSPLHADLSENSLRTASREGGLIICECVLAEIRPSLSDREMEEFLEDWELRFVPSSQQSALLAGKSFAVYLQRGGRGRRGLPDFLIAAHAQTHAARLLARDRGYYRDYFKGLKVWDPADKS